MWKYSSLGEVFEFCWSSFSDKHNTLTKSTMRNVQLNKFEFGNPWLLDSFCQHWFTSSVWNFCPWVAESFLIVKSPQPRGARRNLCFCRLTKNWWCNISRMRYSVSSPDETLRGELKIWCAAEYFWQTSRWYYFSNKMIFVWEVKDAKMSSFSSDFQTFIKH